MQPAGALSATPHIEALGRCEQQLECIAQWLHAQWPVAAGGRDLPALRLSLRERVGATAPPMSWVAHCGPQLAGFVSLVEEEHPLQPGLLPCLAELYVPPDWRRLGIGAALCRQVRTAALQRGLPGLWLYTRDRQDYFAAQGWSADADIVVPTAQGLEWVTMMRDRRAPLRSPR